jgi:chemotaxis protein MotB
MARSHRWIAVATLGLSLTGCVSQEKYNALKLDRDQLSERLSSADAESRAAKEKAELLRSQLEGLMANGGTKDGLLANLQSQNSELQRQLDELNRRYSDAVNGLGKAGTALPAAVTSELEAFAAQNPDLVEFDSKLGIVKFKSDVTFASGDATVTPKAKEVIAKFATILNGPNTSSYELLVAGHTDNTPVSNPATKANGHKDNWYLSSHRAISVGKELQTHGVTSGRIGVLGYADQRPVAGNDTTAGKAQNRRVEVLILPRTVGSSNAGSASAAAPARRSAAGSPAAALNKDTVVPTASVSSAPVLNK